MPVVGIPCDRRLSDGMSVHQANDEYVRAVRDGAGALPLLIPVTDAPLPVDDVLAAVDGLLFAGSPSNVAPALYGGTQPRDARLLDAARDATALPLLRAAIAAGKPLLCICRGFQELNVRIAEGGVLARLAGAGEAMVNSLHHQGIERLAPGLAVEAVAPDGLIEAVSGGPGFLLGVQWHPEWSWAENPLDGAIFGAFGAALAANRL